MAPYVGSTMTVVEAIVHVRFTPLILWLKIILLHCGLSHFGYSLHQGPPEVVTPLRITSTDKSMRPPGWISYSLHFGGQRHIVHMKVNKHLLARHMPVFTYTDQGALLEDQPFVQSDCFYHGYVEGDPESLVALTSCFGGFRGMLQVHEIAYEIKPKDHSNTLEHLVYRMESKETSSPMRCGLTDEEIERQPVSLESKNSTLMQSGYEDWWTHSRILKLALVADHNRYIHSNENVTQVYSDLCIIVNRVGSFLKALEMDMILVGIEIWTQQNPVSIVNIITLVDDFCKWKKLGFNTRVPHDASHLFVKQDYGHIVGYAYVGAACSSDYACGVDSFVDDDLDQFAYTVAHELGHNLGMNHDNGTCYCGVRGCIMYPTITVTTRFSNCSYGQFWKFAVQRGGCLFKAPEIEQVFMYERCGNHVVEAKEECDCGSLKLCAKDPCCQSNCTLRHGATCASGLCCKDCQLLPSGTVCRAVENACDLPEWCNGTSHLCPKDVYLQGGLPCEGGGYCYGKRCNNRDEQCGRIFGKGAKSANDSCYKEVNVRGDRFGHCGFQGSEYVQCEEKDILCGRVQCVDVPQIPLLSNHNTVHWTFVEGIACWGTDFHFGMAIPDIGEVKDGTECGADRICIERKCVNMTTLSRPCTPKLCNMKGVCNNLHHCHCNHGRSPPFCADWGTGGSVDSGPPPREESKGPGLAWLIRLLLFTLSILILIALKNYEKGQSAKEKTESKGIKEAGDLTDAEGTKAKEAKHIEIIDPKDDDDEDKMKTLGSAPSRKASLSQKGFQKLRSMRQKSKK